MSHYVQTNVPKIYSFSSPNGHGFHTKLTSVIRKVSSSELVMQLRELLILFRNRLNEKDKYIQKLQSKISKNSNPNYQHGIHSLYIQIYDKLFLFNF